MVLHQEHLDQPPQNLPLQLPLAERLLRDILVGFEGRLVVLVDVSGRSRVISMVVLTESHADLQIAKMFLEKTVNFCSVFRLRVLGWDTYSSMSQSGTHQCRNLEGRRSLAYSEPYAGGRGCNNQIS